MIPVSVVIITKNEAAILGRCLKMASFISDDIMLVDNGSIDDTLKIAEAYGCRIYHKNWDGYGANKNKGIALARHDWILSIDADEIADVQLIHTLHQLAFDDPDVVYDIRFRSYFGDKLIKYGTWGRDHHRRLFNRTRVRWSETEVHETLLLPHGAKIKRVGGYLHHYSVQNIAECDKKAVHYAQLSALKYLNAGKKATLFKCYFSPVFGFLISYLIRLGFLDGLEGLDIALMLYKNTRLKYHYLKLFEEGKYLPSAKLSASKKLVVEY
ncbi:glycosyltransferase family 2 protein [Mucilaginibacter gilvus]|uniref:Glycosyltransferase family 2 protein n=1 Tax=Mucilaginibacter gilvus TaxID=2305909 RepID=A0A3S3Z2C0_9SPHI|nr:glycosyltransferase family 2 protein [Mucilaginibacter gilvus]RWY55684.1 glycosyltransferase family 2 protein [Mucilaginibacter gilvus]